MQGLTSLECFLAHPLVPSTHPWRVALSYRVTRITQADLQQITWPCFAPPRKIDMNLSFLIGINQSFVDCDRSDFLSPKSAIWVTANIFKSYKFHLLNLVCQQIRLCCLQAMFSVIVLATAVSAGWKEASRGGGRMGVNLLSLSNVTLAKIVPNSKRITAFPSNAGIYQWSQ